MFHKVIEMNDNTIVKLFAIGSLTVTLIVNFLTMKIDSNITALAFTIIGGVAGYEIGKRTSEKTSKKIDEKTE